jgi:protein-tyrosine phosphatase
MARIAVKDGITHLFATPHHRDYTRLSRQDVTQRVAQVQAELDANDIALTLLEGYEVRLYENMFDDWDNEFAGPLGNSRYVLAEPQFHLYNAATDAMLFELFDRGYIPIMAHPERIGPIQNDLSLIDSFLERGGLTQVTADSLTPGDNHQAKKIALEMLSNGMVHIIASDAHKPFRRKPILSEAQAAAAALIGEEQAARLVSANPLAIVNNQPMPASIMTH